MPSPQVPPVAPARRRDFFPIMLATATALVAYVALHRHGIGMTDDSWAYWQGAVSLAGGHGYTYFDGNRIEAWPPLYSAYLALWVRVAGPYGWVLTTAMGLLIVLQAALWLRLLRTMAAESNLEGTATTWTLVAVFVGLFLAGHERYPFSQGLLYVLLPLFLDATWRIVVHDERRGLRAVALGVLLPLTHTTGLAFLAAAAALIALGAPRTPRRLLLAVLVVIVPAVAWIGVRLTLGQTASHCVGWGVGRYAPLEYALQLFTGPGRTLVPDRFGLATTAGATLWLAALVLSLRSVGKGFVRFATGYGVLVAPALFALFNLAWIYAPIGGRFVLFLPLLLVPAVGLALATRVPRLATGLLALLLLPQLYWLGVWTLDQRDGDALLARQPFGFMPHDGYATRGHLSGPPLRQGNRLLVAPDPGAQIDGSCR